MKTTLLRLLILGNLLQSAFAQSVDLSTGAGSVTIPIYTLKEAGITVPISLNYDATGVSVDAEASNVGLNWSLNVGAKIIRVPRGNMPDGGLLKVKRAENTEPRYYKFNGNFADNGNQPGTGASDDGSLWRDYEPDVYLLVLNGSTIPFMVRAKTITINNYQPEITLLKQNQDIKIELLSRATDNNVCSNCLENLLDDFSSFDYYNGTVTGFRGFRVTINDGTIYEFGLDARSKEYTFTSNSMRYFHLIYVNPDGAFQDNSKITASPIAWNLSRIIPKRGYPIDFTYSRVKLMKDKSIDFDKQFSEFDPAQPCSIPKRESMTAIGNRPIYLLSQLDNIQRTQTPRSLFKVTFNEGVSLPVNINKIIPDMTGTPSTERLDLSNDYSLLPNVNIFGDEIKDDSKFPKMKALKTIVITDNVSGKKIGYFLHHGYFNEYFIQNQSPITRNETNNARLKLLGLYPIKFKTDGTIELENGHRFIYNNQPLPLKRSLAADHWGFPNGQDYNDIIGTNIPKPKEFYNVSTPCQFADREPRLNYSISGVLHTVVFPSGGWSEIEYEQNDASNYFERKINGVKDTFKKVGGLRVSKIKTYDNVTNQYLTTKYSYVKPNNTTESSGFLSIIPTYLLRITNLNKDYINSTHATLLKDRFINGNDLTYESVKVESITTNAEGNEINNGYTWHEFYVGEKQPYLILNSATGLFEEDNGSNISGECFSRYVRTTKTNNVLNTELPTYSFTKGLPKSERVYNRGDKLLSQSIFSYLSSDLTTNSNLVASLYIIPNKIKIDGKDVVSPAVLNVSQHTNNILSASIKGYSQYSVPIGYALLFFSLLNDYLKSINDESDYTFIHYSVPVGKVFLRQSVDKKYNIDNEEYIQTTTTNYYESVKHNQLTKTESYISDHTNPELVLAGQSKYETWFKYSNDFNTANASSDELKGIAALQSRKMNVLIEQVNIKDGKVLGGNYFEYYSPDKVVPPPLTNYSALLSKTYSLEALRPIALSNFQLASEVSGGIVKNSKYIPKLDIMQYNSYGQPMRYKNPSHIIENQVNFNLTGPYPPLPTSTSIVGGSLSMETQYEYIPLFGVTKTTAPDNTFVTTTYDELGRVTKIKDFKGDTRKSFDYKTVLPKQPTLDFGFKLIRSADNADLVDITNGLTINKSSLGLPPAIPNVNIRIVPPAGIESVAFELQGPISRSSTDSQGTLWRVFEDASTNGFNILDITANGTYTLTAKVYSKPNERGDLIGIKKITFTIQ